MSRTTFTILAAGLAVAACSQATELRTDEGTGSKAHSASNRLEKAADKLFSALDLLAGKATRD